MDNPRVPGDEVGYRKPPKKTQFQKGQSGTPTGRPKGAKGVATLVREDCNQLIRAKGPKGPRMITKLQATITVLGNKALQGDPRAARHWLTMALEYGESNLASQLPLDTEERDLAMMQTMIKRFQSTTGSWCRKAVKLLKSSR